MKEQENGLWILMHLYTGMRRREVCYGSEGNVSPLLLVRKAGGELRSDC
jgi:hypothetical protein